MPDRIMPDESDAAAAAHWLTEGPENKEVGIVMLSAIGDAVHVLPVVNALKRACPKLRLTWVIQPVPHLLAESHPAVDEFIVFRRRRGTAAWRSYRELHQAMRGRRFDLVLALQVYFKAGLIAGMMPSSFRLGFDRRRARDLNWLFTTHRIPPRPVQHVQDQYFEFLEYLGIDPHPVEWNIRLSQEEKELQQTFFRRFPRRVCGIVVGTSKPGKNWAPDRYARLLEALESDFGLQCVLVGGPSKEEREAADRILALTDARPLDTLGDDLRRLLYLLDGSDLVISPDTGPLHIARAMEVPVVGLYGYTNPKRYGPYRRFSDLVVDGYAEHPDEQYPCSMEYRPGGMDRIEVDAVLAKVDRALNNYVSTQRTVRPQHPV